jgi:membrane protease YdiL (CAAX protease family)
MKRIPKLLLVTFLIQSFVALLAVLVRRFLPPSHLAAILAYVPRPLFLALIVSLFYTKSLAKVPSFLGLRKNVLRPWLIGVVLTIPNAFLLFLMMSWKKIPLAFDPTEAAWHLGFIFIGVALFEEALFRGLIFRQFLITAPWWRAGLYTGGLFAFIHLGNLFIGYPLPHVLYQLFHCLAISMLLGFITWKLNGNIWACVAYHTFNNFYAAAFISDAQIRQHVVAFALVGLLELAISFVAAWILLKGNREPELAGRVFQGVQQSIGIRARS